MASRRELLLGVAASLSVAGCLGSGTDDTDNQDVIKTELDSKDIASSENQASDVDTQESAGGESGGEDSEPLPGFTIQDIELSYYKHLGIITLLEIKNESGNDKFEMRAEAYVPDGLITEAEQWEEIPTSLEYPLELQNDDIWDLRNNIGRLTSFVIKGRVPDGEFGVVKAFSGEEFLKRVGVDANPENPEVSVEAESAETDSQQEQSDDTEATNSSSGDGSDEQTGGAETDTGVDPDEAEDTLNDALG
jgi:hypothetical protein